ncbi:MAG: signal peptide peptidase SppA [Flavobacteriales bacterium]|nr:signal peptide peptidase SppA [Flavobacteriales bacterium]
MTFWKTVWATLVGNIIASILGTLLTVAVIAAIIGALASSEDVSMENESILKIKLENSFTERGLDTPSFNLNGTEDRIALRDLERVLRFAKTDERIEGVYLNIGAIEAAPAMLLEIHNAILDFKSSGKWVIAYSEGYSQAGYFLASAANEVYMYPTGTFDWHGLNAEVMFYKKLLDNLEIEAQVIRGPNNKFKSAVEPFIYDHMSDESRLQMATFIDDIWKVMCEKISAQRGVSVEELNASATSLRFINNNTLLQSKLIDGLLYPDEIAEKMSARLKDKGKLEDDKKMDEEVISYNRYLDVVKMEDKVSDVAQVAVVYAIGGIESGKGDDETIGSDRIAKALRDARLDEGIKAVVLRVNSPGGSALASDVIWREAELIKQSGKVFVVSMGDYAASGGYYIACGADRIFAQPNTITGSIGVFGIIPNLQNFLDHKLGITFDAYKTHEHANMMTLTSPLDTVQKRAMQVMVSNIYNDFTSKVALGRNISQNYVDSIGQGRVWSGEDALTIGLVDEMGGLREAVAYAAAKAGVSSNSILELPEMLDPLEEFFDNISGKSEDAILSRLLGSRFKNYQDIRQLSNGGKIQTRLPFYITVE